MAAKEEKLEKKVSSKVVEISGEKDSFSDALVQAQPKMTGHPATGETEEDLLERKAREKQEEEDKKEAEEKKITPKKKGEKEEKEEEEDLSLKEVRITSKGKEEEKEEEEEEDLGEKARAPKHKTLEESDKALQEAERRMHEATVETAETRRQVAKLQDTLNELLMQQVRGQEEREKAKTEIQKKEYQDLQKKAIKEMLKVVRTLDPEAEDYDERYTEAMYAVLEKSQEGLRQSLKEELKAEVVKEVKPSRKESDDERVMNFANRKALELGLDMKADESYDDEGNPIPSADYRLFWKFAADMPGKTLAEQITNTVKEVKRIRGTYQKPLLKSRKGKEREEERAEEEILGKGAKETPARKEKPAAPMSITDALAQTQRII